MRRLPSVLALTAAALLAAAGAMAQEAQIAFSGLKANAGDPVEITADQLSVSQEKEAAVFKGNVLVIQGGLRLSSDVLTVDYVKGDKTKIERLIAEGNVLLSTEAEAAKGERAVYELTGRTLEMTGNVVLTQNGNVMTGAKLLVDLDDGTGRMDGRVKTILQPAGN